MVLRRLASDAGRLGRRGALAAGSRIPAAKTVHKYGREAALGGWACTQDVEIVAIDGKCEGLPVKVARVGGGPIVAVDLACCDPQTWRFRARGLAMPLKVLLDQPTWE